MTYLIYTLFATGKQPFVLIHSLSFIKFVMGATCKTTIVQGRRDFE